jgi:hypothetical protein
MTLECALEITPGRRLVVAADLRARLLRVYLLYELVQPKPRRSRTSRHFLYSIPTLETLSQALEVYGK